MECGVAVVAPFGSVEAELIGGAGITTSDAKPETLRDAVQPFLDSASRLENQKELGYQRMQIEIRQGRYSDSMVSAIARLMRERAFLAQNDSVAKDIGLLKSALERESAEDIAKALVPLQKKKMTGPDKSEYLCVLGDIAMKNRSFAEAKEKYTESLQSWDLCWRAFRGLGFLALADRQYNHAKLNFEHALSLAGIDVQAMIGLAQTFRGLKRYSESIQILEQVLEDVPNEGTALSLLCQVCNQLEDSAAAVTVLERVRKFVGELDPVLICLSRQYFLRGRDADALALLVGS
jgi:tetratricopeptide (TPR) repeat protein